MTDWRDRILDEFAPGLASLTLVADPDGLLMEERILAVIRQKGFELLSFENTITLRYDFENRFRPRWDRGERVELVAVFQSTPHEIDQLPYDLLQRARRLSFNLKDIFPNLDYSVVGALGRESFDALYAAQPQYTLGALGENDSKDLILRHVFNIVPEFIRDTPDLLRVLLRRHYREQRIPSLLDERLIQLLQQRDNFIDWPLERIVPNRQTFFIFLQERWSVFLEAQVKQDVPSVRDTQSRYGLTVPGPVELPFDHEDVRIYIDNLFLEGLLKPVVTERYEKLSTSWASCGIENDEHANRLRRIEGLSKTVNENIPAADGSHSEWLHYAKVWAELLALSLQPDTTLPEAVHQQIATVRDKVDHSFLSWLPDRYAGLANLPPDPPVMLHHIPRFLAKKIQDDSKQRMAFVLVDGLALDQWVVIRTQLAGQRSNWRFHESAVFAWAPSITSVSRQAAFSGKLPLYFPDSINTTNKEPALWTQFWREQGLTQRGVCYAKGLGDKLTDEVTDMINRLETQVVALVVDKVDKIIHGMELGAAGMHNQVKQWASGPFMVELLDQLLDNGFQVYLSSDHGNIEAVGCGNPNEGALAEQRGERARIYSEALLRSKVKAQFPDALEWPSSMGLPEDYLPLFAPGRNAFVREGERLVCHGGVMLEELVVPFVRIARDS